MKFYRCVFVAEVIVEAPSVQEAAECAASWAEWVSDDPVEEEQDPDAVAVVRAVGVQPVAASCMPLRSPSEGYCH